MKILDYLCVNSIMKTYLLPLSVSSNCIQYDKDVVFIYVCICIMEKPTNIQIDSKQNNTQKFQMQ